MVSVIREKSYKQAAFYFLEPPPARPLIIKCEVCGKNTKGGKPLCEEHVMGMEYAQWVEEHYIDPFIGARPLREITPPELQHLLPSWKHLE